MAKNSRKKHESNEIDLGLPEKYDNLFYPEDTDSEDIPEPAVLKQEEFLSLPQLKRQADALIEAAKKLANALDGLKYQKFFLEGNAESFGITIANGQCLVVCSGSIAKESTVGRGGELIVRDGATADFITLAGGAKLTVRKGGQALNVVDVGGEINAEEGSIVTFMMPMRRPLRFTKRMLETSPLYLEKDVSGIDLTVAKDQKLIVCAGNTTENTTVEKGGEIIIRENGTGNGIILKGGKLTVRKGGKALDVVVNKGGIVCVEEGGTVRNPIVKAGGEINVRNGGFVFDVVNAGGIINGEKIAFVTYVGSDLPIIRTISGLFPTLRDNQLGVDILVPCEQILTVYSGCMAVNTTVETGGEFIIKDGAEGNGIILKGGKLTVRKGGKALDVVNDGGVIDAAEGSIVTFAPAPIKKPAQEKKEPASAEKETGKKTRTKKTAKPKKKSKS